MDRNKNEGTELKEALDQEGQKNDTNWAITNRTELHPSWACACCPTSTLPGAQESEPYSNYELQMATPGHWAKETEKQFTHKHTVLLAMDVFWDFWNNEAHKGSGYCWNKSKFSPAGCISFISGHQAKPSKTYFKKTINPANKTVEQLNTLLSSLNIHTV